MLVVEMAAKIPVTSAILPPSQTAGMSMIIVLMKFSIVERIGF